MTPSEAAPAASRLDRLWAAIREADRTGSTAALGELCRVVAARLDAARVSVWLRGEAQDLGCVVCESPAAWTDLVGELVDASFVAKLAGADDGVLAIADTANATVAADLPEPGGGTRPSRGLLAARIVVGGDAVGLVLVEAQEPRSWDVAERESLEVFAGLGALAEETARRRAAQAGWHASRRRYIDLLNNLVEGVFQIDRHGRLSLANPALAAMLGYADPESLQLAYNARPTQFFEPPQAGRALMRRLRRQGSVSQQELRLQRPDGRRLDAAISARTVRDGEGRIRQVDGTVSDVTERRRVADRLRHIAYNDPVTGLANRAGALETLRAYDRGVALILVDLDEFQTVNDSLGLEVGDFILYRVGQRLAGLDSRIVAAGRSQADVFLVVLAGVDQAEAETVATRLQNALEPAVGFGQGSVQVRASLGIALGETPGIDGVSARPGPEELFRRAGVALKRAKRDARGTRRIYDPEMDRTLHQRLETINRLAEAVRERAFEPVYQPEVALADGRVVAAEALARWRQADGSLLAPAAFIEAAEDSGQIAEIGEAVLRAGLACRRDWSAAGLSPPCLAFNLSPRQLQDPGFVDRVRTLLGEAGCPPAAIELEITETALMADLERGVRALEALRALGVQLAVDDFGTGYSSLAYLKALPVDKLKIDRSFVTDLEDEPRANAILATVIRLGRDVGLHVVAEGVETPGQQARLRAAGAEFAQGFLFARPLGAVEFQAYMAHGPEGPGQGRNRADYSS